MIKRLLVSMLLLFTACTYSVYSSGYPHLKTINVLQFKNNTIEYVIEEELFQSLTDQFDKDGRLKLVDLAPDCQLQGEILDYNNKIYGYTKSDVEEYEVKILFQIDFVDLTNNEIIMHNESLLIREFYSADALNSDFQTEEEARLEIYTELFENIIKNSLEKW